METSNVDSLLPPIMLLNILRFSNAESITNHCLLRPLQLEETLPSIHNKVTSCPSLVLDHRFLKDGTGQR